MNCKYLLLLLHSLYLPVRTNHLTITQGQIHFSRKIQISPQADVWIKKVKVIPGNDEEHALKQKKNLQVCKGIQG